MLTTNHLLTAEIMALISNIVSCCCTHPRSYSQTWNLQRFTSSLSLCTRWKRKQTILRSPIWTIFSQTLSPPSVYNTSTKMKRNPR